MSTDEFTIKLRDEPVRLPSVTYKCECPVCGRKIVVTAAINGSNHNIGVWAACADAECGKEPTK